MPLDHSPQTWIASWLIHDNDATATFMPNVNASSSDAAVQAIYGKCAAILFATSIRQNPNARHLLFTNTDAAYVEGRDVIAELRGWGVEIVRIEPAFRLPDGAVSVFANQFYVLGIIHYLAAAAPDDCRVILLDADCVVLEPLAPMADAISRCGLLGYPLPYEEVNGSSIAGMRKALRAHSPERARTADLVYWGGELFAATGHWCRIIAAEIPAMWDIAVAHAFHPGWIKEEAHLLSVLYAALAPDIGNASIFFRRISTSFKYNDVTLGDLDLAIWHLPAEKKFGLRRVYPLVIDRSSRFWTEPAANVRPLLARYMGIPRRGAKKLVLDFALKALARLPRRPRRG